MNKTSYWLVEEQTDFWSVAPHIYKFTNTSIRCSAGGSGLEKFLGGEGEGLKKQFKKIRKR
jgi:hypothetical protein